MTRYLIANRWQTPDGTILHSKHRHDYVTHFDTVLEREVFLDGGLDYTRISFGDCLKDISVYSNDKHEVKREVFCWGTRGKDGKQPVTFIYLKDMETDHIESVLSTQHHVPSHIVKMFKEELKYRKQLKT